MWIYEKKLQYPVNITSKNLRMAKILMAQYGGLYCNRRLYETSFFINNRNRPSTPIKEYWVLPYL